MAITTPPLDAPESEWDAYYESYGAAKMQILLQTGGWPQNLHSSALQWLARKDAQAALRNAVSQSEQIEIARAAKDAAVLASVAAERAATAAERQACAAESANKRATIALIIATISAIIAIISIALVHWDTIHPVLHP